MFEKLAKFRPFEPRHVSPQAATHSNDNLPGFRRPADRRRPTPACHWVLIDGHLECRWTIDDFEQQRRAGRHFGPRATSARRAAARPRLCA